ncbi:LLM class flavin-dependent oxidoreductase [Streptomyces sp. NPDC058319]|uniref:LLM class flavin-dependent oxidoreductase n=1 Tax=unclassified Streptomyces TaxID=2593676 RepID=UPI0036E95DE7
MQRDVSYPSDRPADDHGTAPAPLSVLDLTVVREGQEPAQALRDTVALAGSAERHGFRRFWVAEHHSFPASGSPAPAVLLAHLAGATDTIRLGSGGVMLTNHAPLVVAEQFGVLEALHPGRFDLGLGRNPGGLSTVAHALRRPPQDPGTDTFPSLVEEVLGFLGSGFPADHPYSRDRVHVVPAAPGLPVWLLGSGTTGAQVAARLGLPFAAAYHINPAQALRAVDLYRSAFRPSAALPEPRVMVSVNVTCAPEAAEAARLATSGAVMMMRARQGAQSAVPGADTAATLARTPEERDFVDGWLGTVVHGTPATVRAGLAELHSRTGADELMLTSLIPDLAERERSYALVAAEFGLSGPARQGCS